MDARSACVRASSWLSDMLGTVEGTVGFVWSHPHGCAAAEESAALLLRSLAELPGAVTVPGAWSDGVDEVLAQVLDGDYYARETENLQVLAGPHRGTGGVVEGNPFGVDFSASRSTKYLINLNSLRKE